MARLARTVAPGTPHHITQRGDGRSQTFFDDDYRFYRDRLVAQYRATGRAVWARVLMPNHVHLILTPSDGDGLRRALARLRRPGGDGRRSRRRDRRLPGAVAGRECRPAARGYGLP